MGDFRDFLKKDEIKLDYTKRRPRIVISPENIEKYANKPKNEEDSKE